ncbi:MAG: hypothetical protein EOO03_04310 [Chitinophagaceae bacterium]|nr:MAG: hypothetical protein EOO03_04310 [Chitinophagaceae bacterium]
MSISEKLMADSFLMAMIDQVDITAQRSFEMIPKIGNQTIVFGDAVDADEKFNKLKLFYKKVITTAGFNRYSVINLQYKDQVVAKIKGAEDKTADSLRTLQIMQVIAERAAQQAADSVHSFLQDSERNTTDSTLIQESMERDEPDMGALPGAAAETSASAKNAESNGAAVVPTVVAKPAVKKPVAKPAAKPTTKPAAKPAGNKPKPKAVMGG